MKTLLVGAALLCACGDNADAPVDAAPDAGLIETPIVPECHDETGTNATSYFTAADFGPITPGSLAGWDPDGRWFLTGVKLPGVSSYHLTRSGDQVIVDRDTHQPGTIDNDVVFQRSMVTDAQNGTYVISRRVSDRQPDGSLRADLAICGDGTCTVCQARMVRATHNGAEGEGDHISFLSELRDPTWGAGYTFNVRVAGTLAYLIRQDGLHIIETADPAHPVELGRYRRSGGGYSNDVKLVEAGGKRFALIADYPVDVVDVTNPAAPALAAQIPEEAHTLAVEQRGGKTYAYFGDYDGTCPIYDVTNPAAPARLGRYRTAGNLVHDLSVDNGIAYLNAWDAGLVVVDFTTPAAPTLVGSWAPTPTRTSHSNWTTMAGGKHIALHGEESYGAHLDIVDLATMQPFASYKTRDHVSIHNIMAFGTRAYFTYYQDGVRILDVADPAHPTLLGYYNTWDPQAAYTTSGFFEGAVGLDVDRARKLIFVADHPRGLIILHDDTP